MNVIETKNLTKFYGKARGIVDVTLSVKEGDIFGFVGPNGAGKSTLIRTLLGLISSTGGSAEVLGKDASLILKDSNFFCDLNGTSIEYYALLGAIKSKLGVEIVSSDALRLATVSDFAAYIQSR